MSDPAQAEDRPNAQYRDPVTGRTIARWHSLAARPSRWAYALRIGLLAALPLCGLPAIAAADGATITGPVRVVDGDGLKIDPVPFACTASTRPRWDRPARQGPPGTWTCGAQSTNRLQSLAEDRDVSRAAFDRDDYGRIVARCRVDGVDVAAEMIEASLAWAYVEHSAD